MGLGPEPMNWDVDDVFHSVQETSLHRPRNGDDPDASERDQGGKFRRLQRMEYPPWKRREQTGLNKDRQGKTERSRVQTKFDNRMLLGGANIRPADIGKPVQKPGDYDQGREVIAHRELAFKNLTNEQARNLEDWLEELDRQLSQLCSRPEG